MRPIPVVRLLLLLIALALLCAAPASAWAAPTITWYRIHHLTGEWSDMSGSWGRTWNQRVGLRVRPDSPGEAVRSVTVTVNGTERTNESWWPAPDGTDEVCFCTDWDELTLPPEGSYICVAHDQNGVSSEPVVAPALGYLEPIPKVVSPPPGGVIWETTPTFAWLPYPGFAGDGAPSVERQGVGVSDATSDCLWNRCDITPGETSAVYEGAEPLQPGHVYWVHFLECAPTVVLQTTPEGAVFGEYIQQTGRFWQFAVYSPTPTVEGYRLDHVTLLRSGDSSPRYAYVVGVRFGSVWERERVTGLSVQPPGGEAQELAFWPACGDPGAEVALCSYSESAEPPAIPAEGGTYAVTVAADGEATTFLAGPVTHFPEPVPTITYPTPGQIFDPSQPFTWEPYGGFTCEGPPPVPAAWQFASVEPLDESARLWSCELAPELAEVAYGAGAESPPPLEPGQSYLFNLQELGPDLPRDPIEGGPPGVFREETRADAAFSIYSPLPVIQSADICRGRCLCADPGSTEFYHEGARVSVLDCDGWEDAAVTIQTPDGLTLPDPAGCDNTTNDGHYTLNTGNAHSPETLGTGSYTISAADTAGHAVSITSTPVSEVPPRHEITSPTNDAVLPEGDLTPTFSWTGATGAAYSCVCVLDRAAGDTVLWVRRSIPGDVTSVVYNDEGSATVPQLSPGGRYLVKVRAHYPDEDPGDGVAVDTFTGTAANFYTYSPPAIGHATINRGRDRDACEEICYHQEAQVLLVGIADPTDVTVTVTAPGDDEPHQAWFQCQPDAQTVAFCWQSCGHPAPLPPGTYTVTMADSAGRTDSVSIQVSEIPDNTPVLQVPAGDSVTSALPSFLWSGPADVCYCLGVGIPTGTCRLWCGGRYVSGSTGTATYNDNGAAPPLDPGGCYRWGVRPTIPDLPQSDARASSAFTPRAFARFWVEPKFVGFLDPINDDGSSIFRLGATVPVKFQLIAADGSQVTDADCQLHVTKVTDDIVGTYEEAVGTSAADSGSSFRYVDDHYQFNLGTKMLSQGTYRLRVTVNGATAHEATISLK